ncbi:MAG: hypothetical protein O3A63_14515 [Proteobacteria bacterium]|nr:hypothetical protein [Pseudomonadota bacterium]
MAPQNKSMDGQLLLKCVMYAVYGLTFVALDFILEQIRTHTYSQLQAVDKRNA